MRSWGLIALALIPLFGADKKLPIGVTSDDMIEVSGILHIDKDEIKGLLGNVPGSDLGGTIVVVEVKVRPLTEKAIDVSRDDFTLISDRDGQRSGPFEASQIAGNGTLTVRPTSGGGSVMGDNNGPIWGGIPGTMGGPRRLPGNGGSVGGGADASGTAEATVQNTGAGKETPLMRALREKILPEKSITEPMSGLLYFPIDGKVKAKNLELYYHPRGREQLGMRFPVPGK